MNARTSTSQRVPDAVRRLARLQWMAWLAIAAAVSACDAPAKPTGDMPRPAPDAGVLARTPDRAVPVYRLPPMRVIADRGEERVAARRDAGRGEQLHAGAGGRTPASPCRSVDRRVAGVRCAS